MTQPTVPHVPGVTLVRAPNPGPMTLDGTNTWLLDDGSVIDPGPDDEAHLAAVVDAMAQLAGPVRRILLTHRHPDHAEGVPALVRATGAEVVDVVGQAGGAHLPAGLAALPTPGHTADSVCFVLDRDGARAVFTGDTILGRGSSVVAWPDGDVGAYLSSLDRLCGFEAVAALPGHGPALPDCAAAARWLHQHRIQRLDQVRAALAAGARTTAEVVAAVYPDVDPAIRFAAEWSVRAQLDHLGHTDAAAPDPERATP